MPGMPMPGMPMGMPPMAQMYPMPAASQLEAEAVHLDTVARQLHAAADSAKKKAILARKQDTERGPPTPRTQIQAGPDSKAESEELQSPPESADNAEKFRFLIAMWQQKHEGFLLQVKLSWENCGNELTFGITFLKAFHAYLEDIAVLFSAVGKRFVLLGSS